MNKNFGFHLPTRIEVGAGLINSVGTLTNQIMKGKKALIITDPGIIKVGLAQKVEDSLMGSGYTCQYFEQVQPNPKDNHCEQGGQLARDFQADVIIAVGGGSVIDAAKAIALMQTHPGKVQDYQGRGKVVNEVTPIVAIPTTAGTGSEVTRSAVITDSARKFKMTVKDIKLAPRLAIVDPETTYRLPAQLTASTGMDALVHAIEAYSCRLANPTSDATALAAIERIFPNLRSVVFNGEDKQARYEMMVGSLMAGIAFSHADVAAVHCMAEALGGRYDTPHGVANSMFLPIVTRFNVQKDPERHRRIAMACGLPVAHLKPEEGAEVLVDELEKLSQAIGIPAFNSLTNVLPGEFDLLAEAAFENGSTPSNCREITKDDYLRLFKESYYDQKPA